MALATARMMLSRNAVRSFLLNAAVQQLKRVASHPGQRLGWLGDARLTPEQIAAVAANAGFQGDDLPIAVAIALAESSGVPSAYNQQMKAKGKTVVGLWQIYVDVHPEFANWPLTDPATNARVAYILFSRRGGNFKDWETYLTGAYQRYLPQAQQGVDAITGDSSRAGQMLNTVMPDGRVYDPAGNQVDTVASSDTQATAPSSGPAMGIIAAAVTFLAVDYLFLSRR